MSTIFVLVGSLRQKSFNVALARAAIELFPDGVRADLATIRDVPVFDGDLETSAFPPSVTALKDRMAAADALLLVSPEYNQSLPGALKNAVDWMTRPSSDVGRVFADKPAGVIGATPGPGGTRLSQTAWLPVFRNMRMSPWLGRAVLIAHADKSFDAEGRLTDEATRKVLQGYVEGFAAFVRKVRGS